MSTYCGGKDNSKNENVHVHVDTEYFGWSDVTVICGHSAISMLCGNTQYSVKLSGEDLVRY